MLKATGKYLEQRPSEKVQLVTIDTNTLSFFDNLKYIDGVYVIPTKIDVVQSYDFERDVNGILDEIKMQILGQDEDYSRSVILEYPEISTVHLKIKPLRYSEVPKLKSRIQVTIEEQD